MKVTTELIALTPITQLPDNHVVALERFAVDEHSQLPDVFYEGAGPHSGLVIRKRNPHAYQEEITAADVEVTFKVDLFDSKDGNHQQERRRLCFWYEPEVKADEKETVTHEFLKTLLSDFPKDYVGFLKKMMKLMQNSFLLVTKIVVHMKIVPVDFSPGFDSPTRDSTLEVETPTEEHVQELLEHAFPNGLKLDVITNTFRCSEDQILEFLNQLKDKGLVKCLESGHWVRIDRAAEFGKYMVKTIPKSGFIEQPTIAIITALYVEKVAVDSMIENKKTYVRYKTDGESNVYTLGNIGDHVVVSTKLSAVGSSRSAMISAGSITTRLLGTFPGVEHVFIVGAGGGVPDFSDNKRGVRLGDVVISARNPNRGKDVYIFCEKLHRSRETNEVEGFTVNSWIPDESSVDIAAETIKSISTAGDPVWLKYVDEGVKVLSESGVCERFCFDRPPAETDILTAKTRSQTDKDSLPMLHLGPIGAGRLVARVSMLRNEFARRYGVICFDAEFDAVVQSIFGNRIGSWALIRGIADYVDGTKSKQWQPYAAMQSAAVLKTLLLNMPAQK